MTRLLVVGVVILLAGCSSLPVKPVVTEIAEPAPKLIPNHLLEPCVLTKLSAVTTYQDLAHAYLKTLADYKDCQAKHKKLVKNYIEINN